MNKYLLIAVAGIVLLGAGFLFFNNSTPVGPSAFIGEPVVIHKSFTCGCCSAYSAYLRKLGYVVEERNMSEEELTVVKEGLGVPEELWSCHTLELGGYIAEGHLPAEVLEKLLTNKPDLVGIGMPGMPSGSPGMPGLKTGAFTIHSFTHRGMMGDTFMIL